ncbi:MAG: NTPase [Bacteroidales bacterium]|nr:NTPase [Bacteroidales bacterium]
MWSDKETTQDLLGYTVHASLLKNVVTNDKNLPITVGLYGDWGSGKSSILKILEEQLNKEDDTVVVYFDGWSFESFDDAKMALIQGIVDALEKDERFLAKVKDNAEGAYDAVKQAFVKLRKSINWMRVLKFSAKTIVPVATAATTGGASLIIPLLLEAFKDHKGDLADLLTGDKAEQFLKDAINAENEEKKYEAVREFRKDFEDLIKKSRQGKIVILIDDLDRCLPRHIIENLEAIKLFLDVPKTAFVIAADSLIVSNAIKSEYKDIIDAAGEEGKNIGDAYMEKFIQLPYKIPALSPKEVETYVTLLFCQSFLDKKAFEKVQVDFANFTLENKFDIYGWDKITKALEECSIPDNLGETVGFVTHFSKIIGNALKWNPRLIKRFLNAYEIRSSLLAQSEITDLKSRFALLKLMLIEQKHIDQFKQLNTWVMGNQDIPKELLEIEDCAEDRGKDISNYQDWNSPDLLKLISTEPKFSEVDMKELFWVSRDNLVDEMSGLSLISTRVKTVFSNAYNASSDTIREDACKKEIKVLSPNELDDLYELLDSKLLMAANDKNAYSVYYFCIMNDVERAYQRFLAVLSRITVSSIPFSLGNKFKDILAKYGDDKKLKERLKANERLMRAIEDRDTTKKK